MSEATKRPWHTDKSGFIIFDADGWAIADAKTFHGKTPLHDAKANAALIVRAVNHFDDFVAMVRRLVADNVDTPGETIMDAEALLAKLDATKGG